MADLWEMWVAVTSRWVKDTRTNKGTISGRNYETYIPKASRILGELGTSPYCLYIDAQFAGLHTHD